MWTQLWDLYNKEMMSFLSLSDEVSIRRCIHTYIWSIYTYIWSIPTFEVSVHMFFFLFLFACSFFPCLFLLIWFGLVLWHINHWRFFNAKSIFIHINSSISNNSDKYNTHFSSIWPIDRTLSSATTPVQSEPGSDGSEEVLCIPQSSSNTGTSPSDCLVSYLGHSLE